MRDLQGIMHVIYMLINFSLAAGLVCYNCQNMAHPRDCGRIAECGTNEECYVESRITTSGNVLYNSGCSSPVRCRASGKRSAGFQTLVLNDTQIQRRSDIVTCYKCCKSTSYCNQDKCDDTHPAVSLTNRTTCLSCQNVESPDKCEFTQVCDVNKVCYTEIIRVNGEDRFHLGCVEPMSCTFGGSSQPTFVGRKRFIAKPRRTNYCGKCCKDGIGNCNRDLCRTGGVLTQGALVAPLVVPPPQQNCEDIDTVKCKKLKQTDPDACLNTTISNYDCRKTCRCSSGSSTGGTTSVVLPKTDCFYESSQYKGVYRTTSKGEVCISWSTVYGNTVPPGPGFPEPNILDAENKCRDPIDGRWCDLGAFCSFETGKGHPWCYTSKLAWDYCDVPYCEDCYYPGHKSNFTGYISKNIDNQPCDLWASYKGQNDLLDRQFPDGSAANAGRYCRDPFRVGFMCVTSGILTACDVKQCQGTCQDDPSTNCTLIKNFVCSTEYIKKTLCPKTCGHCDVGLLPPRKVQPPVQACSDVTGANCPVLKDIICKDASAAKNLCPRTCNVGCAVQAGTTMATTTLAVATWSSWGTWDCQFRPDNTCYMLRRRTCPTGAVCTPGSGIDLRRCTAAMCAGYTGTVATPTTAITTKTTHRTTVSTTLATTKQPDQCHDDPAFKCNPPDSPEIKLLVCTTLDPKLSASLCPKTCGYCDGCKDVFNCSSQQRKDYFCSENELAITFCKDTCRKCLEKTIPVTLNNCGDPVAETTCPLLDRELCICKDLEIRPLCEHFCNGDCTKKPLKPEANESCKHNGSNTTRKRALVRQTLGEFYGWL